MSSNWHCCKTHLPTGMPGSTKWPTVETKVTTTAGIDLVVDRKYAVQPGSKDSDEVSLLFLIYLSLGSEYEY